MHRRRPHTFVLGVMAAVLAAGCGAESAPTSAAASSSSSFDVNPTDASSALVLAQAVAGDGDCQDLQSAGTFPGGWLFTCTRDDTTYEIRAVSDAAYAAPTTSAIPYRVGTYYSVSAVDVAGDAYPTPSDLEGFPGGPVRVQP